eukprot:5320766-Pyramimonas_sp.AAC.1
MVSSCASSRKAGPWLQSERGPTVGRHQHALYTPAVYCDAATDAADLIGWLTTLCARGSVTPQVERLVETLSLIHI